MATSNQRNPFCKLRDVELVKGGCRVKQGLCVGCIGMPVCLSVCAFACVCMYDCLDVCVYMPVCTLICECE